MKPHLVTLLQERGLTLESIDVESDQPQQPLRLSLLLSGNGAQGGFGQASPRG